LYEQRKYSEAEETFRRGLEIEPEHRALLDGIRWAAFYNKNLTAARSYHEKYFEVAPERSEKISALVDLGAIGILQKDYATAEKDLRRALAVDSTSAPANLQMGYLFAEQGRYAEAEAFSKKALAGDSSFAGNNLTAHVLVAGELDIDRGMAYAEKALNVKRQDQPQAVPAYSFYAIIETTRSRVATYSYYAIPQHTLGLACLKKGDYQKAVQYLEQAAALAPEKQAIRDDLQLARQKLQGRAKN
jgi:tetratricopeptide (TPR) repeat protein